MKTRILLSLIFLPGIVFNLTGQDFAGRSGDELILDNGVIKRILFRYSGTGTDCWVMNDYARQKSLGQFTGNWYDPVVVVHEVRHHRGIVLGNESPGVMKRTTAFLKPDLLTAGLTHPDQNFGFREWLKPGKELAVTGFKVALEKKYDGSLFEIVRKTDK